MHALTICYTVSYPYNKGKVTALKKLMAADFPKVYDVLGKETATEAELQRRE